MPETWPTLLVVVAGAAAAGLVQGLSGFAFSMVAMGFWAWALAPEIAAPLAVFGSLLGQLASFASIREGFEFRRIAPFVVGGALGVPIGVLILHSVDPRGFRFAVGAAMTLYGVYGLATSAPARIEFGGRWLDACVGTVGGLLGGLGGMSGAAPAIWTQLRGWPRDLRRATMQAYNTAMHVLTLTAYARTGTLDATTFKLFAVVAPAMLIPSYVGMRLYGTFSERTFARVIFALLLVSGAALLVSVGRGL